MERCALSAQTYSEDAREEGQALSDSENHVPRRSAWGAPKGRFGHLREVEIAGLVHAVEEDPGTWVLVHLHEPSLERCYMLDDELSRLAPLKPNTKLLCARAAVLGFASSSSSSSTHRVSCHHTVYKDDEDDPSDSAEDDEDGGLDEDKVDTDVLSTLFAYRNGEIMHT